MLTCQRYFIGRGTVQLYTMHRMSEDEGGMITRVMCT